MLTWIILPKTSPYYIFPDLLLASCTAKLWTPAATQASSLESESMVLSESSGQVRNTQSCSTVLHLHNHIYNSSWSLTFFTRQSFTLHMPSYLISQVSGVNSELQERIRQQPSNWNRLFSSRRLGLLKVSESICFSLASRLIFARSTATSLCLAPQMTNMDLHSCKSKAFWQTEFTMLPIPLTEGVKYLTLEAREKRDSETIRLSVDSGVPWDLTASDRLSIVGYALGGSVPTCWLPSPTQTIFYLPHLWKDWEDALRRSWQSSHTCSHLRCWKHFLTY